MSQTYSSDYVANGRLATEVTRPVFSKLKDHLAQIKRGEAVSPVQYMMQSIENNEKQLNDHNSYFADTLESILSQQDLTKEQRRAMLMSVNENKLVIDPEHLDPVLSAYEKANDALKMENSAFRRDLTALADTVHLLLGDNAKLSEYLERKNADLSNLLETISENEGELVQSLRANLNLLAEENRALNYEISMLKELRAKDRNTQLILEEKILEDGKINRKIADDFSDVNLRNQSLDNQIKLLELKVKNLNTEVEDERKKREAAERKALLPLKTCPVCQGQGHQETVIWHTKMNTIKEQERLQQENMYANLEKEELKAAIKKLEETIRTKDTTIRDEHTKFSNLEAEISKMKKDHIQLNDANGMLRKKIAELIEQENQLPIGHGAGGEFAALIFTLEEENKRLKIMISELQNSRNINLEQYERMNQDLIDQLRKEAASLKDEKRNLMAKIKILMERKTTHTYEVIGQTQNPGEVRSSITKENTNIENVGLKNHIDNLQAENRDLKRRLEEAQKPAETNPYFGYTDPFPDNISEPGPRRTRGGTGVGMRREREPSPIDDIVEKLNEKQRSRGNTPEAVGRYLLEGETNAGQPGIYRRKANAMVQHEQNQHQLGRIGAVMQGLVFDSPRDPFENATNETKPRVSLAQRNSAEHTSIDPNARPRLLAHGDGHLPFYLNPENGQQVFVQQPPKTVPDQSVSSNLRSDNSQISQGFRPENTVGTTAGLLSNFMRSGNLGRPN